MLNDYNRVTSTEPEYFRSVSEKSDFADETRFTRSDLEDVRKIERLLDVRDSTLNGDKYYLERYNCVCGRTLTFYDFVFTAVLDANHSKSFILHTLLGNKLVLNSPRMVRCSSCNRISEKQVRYGMPSSYLCIDPNPPM